MSAPYEGGRLRGQSGVGTAPATMWEWFRHIAVVGLAGGSAGLLVGGIGGRIFMRIAGALAPPVAQGAGTEAGFAVGEITLDGTLGFVIFTGIFSGLVGAVLYAVFRPWLAWAGRWRGVAFGVLAFAVGSATSDFLNPDNVDFAILGNGGLLVALIVALFIAFGLVIDWAGTALDRRLPVAASPLVRYLYVQISVFGALIALGLVPMLLFTRNGCDCEPPYIASVFVAIAAGATVTWWIGGLRGAGTGAALTARALGYLGVAGAAAFGLLRAVSDSIDLMG